MIPIGEQLLVESPGHPRDGLAGQLDATFELLGILNLIIKLPTGDRIMVYVCDVLPADYDGGSHAENQRRLGRPPPRR